MAAGAGLYFLGAVAGAMALVVLTLMRPISSWLAALERRRHLPRDRAATVDRAP